MMSFGGNNRAQVFFKQHCWNDGGKIEAKYTSRTADMYRHILSKEVAKSMAEEATAPSSPVASQSSQGANGLSEVQTIVSSVVKKPIGAKKSGKTGALGARKLTKKVIGHVAPLKSSSFFSDFRMDGGFSKKSGPSP
ncbi:hypothetical protein PIB30_041674 [Stylosanthes scabra]|uniref:Uncharacterized protein n=1 Tax=Stylosanthes scabra TaxID=79078 RepID=A0ABU6TEL7_9FABA|nr:hypothetical protein [Stylosanthes scabra]